MKTLPKMPIAEFGSGRSERGVALLIVMISIFVLTMLAGGFAYSMRVETQLARNANSEAQLEWLGRSGVEYARWVLAQQLNIPQEPYDALNQVWAGGVGGLGTSNSPLANVQHEIHLAGGSFTWKITDLESKININTATQPILDQAFLAMGVDAGDLTPTVNSILDWIDPDDTTRIQGAESEYYQGLTPPYFAKNGPIDDLSELLLVKGITPDLYWGPASTNHPISAVQPKPRPFGPQNQEQPFTAGLVDLFTPFSDGRININTASATTLQCLPGIDKLVADAIVGGREGEDDGTGLTGPYRSVDQVRRVPEVTLIVAQQLGQFCDVRSRTFQVQVDAQVNGYTRQFIATLGRTSNRDVQVLTFYWK
jgi:general secretion pathway protein K